MKRDGLMKETYQHKQLITLINQLLVICFFAIHFFQNHNIGTQSIIPLIIISLALIDSAYINFINLKENYVLTKFSNLLSLISWQIMLSLADGEFFYSFAVLLSTLTLYKMFQFALLFFFQDSMYRYKKQTNFILASILLITFASKLLYDRLFSVLFLLQWILSFINILFLFFLHRRRVYFVLKNEIKNLLYSFTVILLPFSIYVLVFAKDPEYLSNLGFYLVIILPLFSIHSIAFKGHREIKKYFIFENRQRIIMLTFLFAFILLFGSLLQFNVISYFILIHSIVWLTLLYLMLVYRNISDLPSDSFYAHNIIQLLKEEELKKDFSNYLHDEVLQDLLSIKNMMKKSDRQEIREMIIKILSNLNLSIREQMQEYHPTILKTLSLKENLHNMLVMLKQTSGLKNIEISFACSDELFLVEPYNLVVYRILKELVTNALKHSKCSEIKVLVAQEKGEIELAVEDNGIGLKSTEQPTRDFHKGLPSIQEQIFLLNGKMILTENKPSGLCVTIHLPMKGENSYEYFISR